MATGTGDALRSKQLQRYRTEVLKAYPHSQWLLHRQRSLQEQSEARDRAFDAWTQCRDRILQITQVIGDAEIELEAARGAQMSPASTSAGVREQRARVDAARVQLSRLDSELALAKSEEVDLYENAVVGQRLI